jgi:hypothetical protein
MLAQTATNDNLDLGLAPVDASGSDGETVTIRRSAPGDGADLSRLARLENRRLPRGPHLVAEREGEIVAAVPLHGGRAMADPFMLTADLVAMLQLRARQLAA